MDAAHTDARTGTIVKAVLALALVVSMISNVLAADPSWVGRAVAGWFPVALLLVVDVLGRVPRFSGRLGLAASTATTLVAIAAAIASFSHMREVALAAGESPLVAVLFPLTVDGLAVVCSAALVELSRRSVPDGSGGLVMSSVEGSGAVGVGGLSVPNPQRSATAAPVAPAAGGGLRVLAPLTVTNGTSTREGIAHERS